MSYFYTYRIQFVDGYYYHGSRKSPVPPEEDTYWGSPKTHKEKWKTTQYEKTIIGTFNTGEEMLREESELIGNTYKTDSLCLNQHNNDNFSTLGMRHSESTKSKMRAAKVGFIPRVGWEHSEETKKKYRETRKGKIHSSKLTIDVVYGIRQEFDKRNPILGVGEVQKNGMVLSYERAFSNKFSDDYGITPVNLYNIITGKSWKVTK